MIELRKKSNWILLALLFLIASCDDSENCKLEENRLLRVGFVRINSKGAEADTTLKELIVSGPNFSDTIKARSLALIPLSQNADSCTCKLQFDSVSFDLITFHYSRSMELISPNCGFNTRFKLASQFSGTYTNIDSVAFLNSAVDYDAEKNIKIYLKVKK